MNDGIALHWLLDCLTRSQRSAALQKPPREPPKVRQLQTDRDRDLGFRDRDVCPDVQDETETFPARDETETRPWACLETSRDLRDP